MRLREIFLKRMIKRLGVKDYLLIFLVVLVTILIFTLFDYLVHSLSKEYSVPGYYFRNKIIFGTIIGFAAYLILRKEKLFTKALVFSLIAAILLQIRYFLEGFTIKFVLEFLIFHFLILFFISLLVFKLFEKIEKNKNTN